MVGLIGPQAKVLHVSSYVWNPNTFDSFKTKNPNQVDQPYILHILGIHVFIRIEKNALTFSIKEKNLTQHIAYTYIFQPTITIPPLQRI
jgi:hypothetical protein